MSPDEKTKLTTLRRTVTSPVRRRAGSKTLPNGSYERERRLARPGKEVCMHEWKLIPKKEDEDEVDEDEDTDETDEESDEDDWDEDWDDEEGEDDDDADDDEEEW